MANSRPLYYIGDQAIARLVEYGQQPGLSPLALVADHNTYAALGQRVEQALRAANLEVNTIMLKGEPILADAGAVMQVLVQAERRPRTYLAVGSGTITDIVRFVSHRSGTAFISVPTAPSVDGFTSIGAPLVFDGQKVTLVTQAPLAVFADLPTLCAAPHAMLASGFGDMLGKFTSIADWQLGALLWGDAYDPHIARRMQAAANSCAQCIAEIGRASQPGVRCLMDALVESGFCMLEFGNTNPASGAEHHISHYWEMKLIWEGRPPILHGAKVGVACVLVAGYWDQVKRFTPAQVADRLRARQAPDRQAQLAVIKSAYGTLADSVIAGHARFLDMSPAAYRLLVDQIIEKWADILTIADQVPAAQQLADWLGQAGGPVRPEELGLRADDVATALQAAHYYRNRFSILKLGQMLGILGGGDA